MSQINTKLSALTSSVDRIEEFLDATQRSKVKTAAQELGSIIARIDYIRADTHKTDTAIAQISAIQRTALKAINLCQELAKNEVLKAKDDDHEDVIKARIDTIGKHLIEYHFAVRLYGVSTLLEIHLRNITDLGELATYKSQIDRVVEQYKSDFQQCQTSVEQYLNNTHALNDRNIIQNLASGAAGILSAAACGLSAIGAAVGVQTFHSIDDLFADNQNQKKKAMAEHARTLFESTVGTAELDAPSDSIARYISAVGSDIEIVKVGSDYYTNLPE